MAKPFEPIPDETFKLFDVTVETVIGTVYRGDHTNKTPLHGALELIANHAKDGVYRFPGPHEDSETVVTVEGVE